MTVRELIHELSTVDNDILDYKVGIASVNQVNKNVKITSRCEEIIVSNHADVDGKMLWIKARNK